MELAQLQPPQQIFATARILARLGPPRRRRRAKYACRGTRTWSIAASLDLSTAGDPSRHVHRLDHLGHPSFGAHETSAELRLDDLSASADDSFLLI